MKKINLFKMLAVLVVLITCIPQMRAWDVVEGQVYYFKPSTKWKEASPRFAVAFGIGDNTYAWYTCIAVSGETDVYYVQSPGNYDWMILTRQNPANSTNSWDNKWTESGRVQPNSNYNRFDVKGGSDWAYDFDWKKYAPPMSSATLTSTATTYGGDGTEGNPYQIKKGTTLSVSASATSTVDGGYTKYYQFYKKEGADSRNTWGSRATTNTASVTASSTVGVTYEIDVVAQNEYYSEYGTTATSSKMYFITVDPIYAILGEFNSWSRSAATWDLSDQGSNNWDATFTLDKGTYDFKVVYNSIYYGKGTSSSTTITRASNSVSGLETGGSVKNIKITADYTGTYTFRFNSSTKNLTITYPTIRQVNYSVITKNAGTGGGTPTTSPSVSSGGYVVDGTSVTFTAKSANTDYTWRGWFTKNNPSNWTDGKVSEGTSLSYTKTINATTTLYAIYSENDYTVTVGATTGGTITTPAAPATSVTAHPASATAIVAALNNLAWRFKGWVKTAGSGTITFGNASNLSTTVKATSDATIQAQFETRYGLVGSRKADGDPAEGMPGWTNSSSADFSVISFTSVNTDNGVDLECTRSLLPNRTYKFQVYDRAANARRGCTTSGGAQMTLGSNWQLNGTNDVWITTEGYGNYTFKITKMGASSTYYPSLQVNKPTSYQLTLGRKVFYNNDASSETATDTNGGTVTAHTNENSTGYDIATGQYFASGSNITFTATPATGYEVAGWYSDAACTTPYTHNGTTITISGDKKTLTLTNLTANTPVYVKYSEILTRVYVTWYGGTLSFDGAAAVSEHSDYVLVGKHTTHTVAISTENAGYYFANWTLSASDEEDVNFTISEDAASEDSRTVTLTGLGAAGSGLNFLSANFKMLETIYFRNVFDDGTNPATHWSTVYAYFDITWNGETPTKAVTSAYNSSKNLHVHMTQQGTSDIWWAYVPRYATRYNKTNVAFADFEITGNSTKFDPGTGKKGNASTRGDYNKALNMFVPNHEANKTNADRVDYYDNGFWLNYALTPGEDAGYKLYRHTGTNTYSEMGKFTTLNYRWETPKIQYRLRVDGLSQTEYIVKSDGNIKYKAIKTISSGACDNIAMVEDNGANSYFTLSLTAEGEYVITIDQSGDSMRISVNYPVAVNDYVIEHTYKGRNKANTADSTYTTRSNVIKSMYAATTARYSMYLNPASATLKLRQCTSISGAGVPTWSDVDADTNSDNISDGLAAIMTAVGSTKGVYQFDVAVETTGNRVSELDSIRLYTGNFYIKTDAAPGGWVAYKNNILDKNTVNFSRTNADTYDNYFCKYFASRDCNIKSVIANDYCNQLSDTVKGDGIARMEGTEPFVPVDGTSIRFSYNSATNETKRAYLGASSNNDFMSLVPSTDNMIYRTISATTYDLYDQAVGSAQRKFADNGNWVYKMDLTVKPGGQAGVTAAYTDAGFKKHTQTLVATDNVVLGGTGTGEYTINLIYDFKTNYMMSSFILPSSEITDKLSNVDMLWVRHKDHSPQQLLLGDGGELKNVSVVGAIELRYDSVHNSGTGTGHVSMGSWTQYNRPFLKYFVSFPFDVPVNSVFGLNQAELGREYVIQKYNGAKRAKEGLFGGDGDNYWENLTKDSIMHANEGYCVIFDNEYVSGSLGHIWDNKESGSSVYLYFPAKDKIASITNSDTIVKVDSLYCRINRAWANDANKNHQKTDSHWHMIGSPLFHDSYIKSRENLDTFQLRSYYKLDYTDNKWKAQAITDGTTLFKAMSSVMVQWYGNVTWTTTAGPYAVPVRTSAPMKNYLVQLDLSYNGNTPDWAYVQLQDGADDDFILREDMYKMYNSGIPQIYTFAGAYDVAYNGVPIKSQIIPVGVLIRKNGTYTFSMPTTFSGTVTLIDTFEQTRTDLSLTDYTVELEKGTINDRFLLEINIENVVTSLENENGNNVLNDGGAHKFIKNDNMYILRNGIIYDAQGRKVK